jgi:hypothetical protein
MEKKERKKERKRERERGRDRVFSRTERGSKILFCLIKKSLVRTCPE